MMERTEIVAKVNQIATDALELKPGELEQIETLGGFMKDSKKDSLPFVEMMIAIEEAFEIEIGDEEIDLDAGLDALYDLIEQKLQE